MSQKSDLEEKLAEAMRAYGLSFTRQCECIPGRKFRADFLVYNHSNTRRLCVEVDGGVWISHNNRFRKGKQAAGGHQSGYGKEADATRDCVFLMEGITTLRVTKKQIVDGDVIRAIDAWRLV